jgi:dTDP-4-amino-4,6-dideoxygalactose transaminase
MAPAEAVVPVYPTLAHLWRLPRPSVRWGEWFPFNVPGGSWAFSGRVALYHGLPSLELPEGSTILVPAYHQGVEIDTLLAAGHRLRYYRVTEHLLADLEDIERQLDLTVSALYVIHYFGFPQPLGGVRRLCEAHGLRLIEDCALSLFSRDQGGTWLGSVGDLALFSVYKTLPLPHGGFFVTGNGATRNGKHRKALRPAPLNSTVMQSLDLMHAGLQASRWSRVEQELTRAARWVKRLLPWDRAATISSGGALWDSRLLAYGASAWSVWLMRFIDPEEVVARRRRNFARLESRLRGQLPLPFPDLPPGVCPLFFPVMVPDKPRFQEAMARLGVQTVNLWDASHPTCPPDLAEEVSGWRRHCLELPIHQELRPEDVDRIGEAVLTVLSSQQ